MDHELTPWFPGHIKPHRPGVYELDFTWSRERWFARWTGWEWAVPRSTPTLAEEQVLVSLVQDDLPWRGLAHEAVPSVVHPVPYEPTASDLERLWSEADGADEPRWERFGRIVAEEAHAHYVQFSGDVQRAEQQPKLDWDGERP